MSLDEIKNNVIKMAQQKLNQHKMMGNRTALSILEVAELHDIISGKAENARIQSSSLIGRVSLN